MEHKQLIGYLLSELSIYSIIVYIGYSNIQYKILLCKAQAKGVFDYWTIVYSIIIIPIIMSNCVFIRRPVPSKIIKYGVFVQFLTKFIFIQTFAILRSVGCFYIQICYINQYLILFDQILYDRKYLGCILLIEVLSYELTYFLLNGSILEAGFVCGLFIVNFFWLWNYLNIREIQKPHERQSVLHSPKNQSQNQILIVQDFLKKNNEKPCPNFHYVQELLSSNRVEINEIQDQQVIVDIPKMYYTLDSILQNLYKILFLFFLSPWLTNERVIIDKSQMEQLIDCVQSQCELDEFLQIMAATFSSNLSKFFLEQDGSYQMKSEYDIYNKNIFFYRHVEVNSLNQSQQNPPTQMKQLRNIISQIFQSIDSIHQMFFLLDLKSKTLNVQDQIIALLRIKENEEDLIIISIIPIIKKQYPYLETKSKMSFRSDISQKLNDSINQELIANTFASISHEFGTHLNCILTVSETAFDDEQIDSQFKEQIINPIRINGIFLAFILSSIRDFNQILLDQFALKMTDFDILVELKRVTDLVQMQLQSRNNKLEIHSELVDDFLVFNDADRFMQIIHQLLSNAIRFTQNGLITIHLKLVQSPNIDVIKISVTDTGFGMNDDEQLKLNQLLQKNLKMRKISKNSVGCGLGLTISNIIGEIMSGEIKTGIQFQSSQNQGSTFSFYVGNSKQIFTKYPIGDYYSISNNQSNESHQSKGEDGGSISNYRKRLKKSEKNVSVNERVVQSQQQQSQNQIQLPKQRFQRNDEQRSFNTVRVDADDEDEDYSYQIEIPILQHKLQGQVLKFDWRGQCCSRVLIVDDEHFNMVCLKMILKKYNPRIDYAYDGRNALDMVELRQSQPCLKCGNKGYSVYFIDINMPIMDGFQTVSMLKMEMNSGILQKGICIANTAFVDIDTKIRCHKEGMDFYLSKPIRIKELQLILEQVFKIND